MAVTQQSLAHDFSRFGVQPGDTLLVHSSLSSLGRVDGGPDAVIDALFQALTSEGTLLMPSFQNGGQHSLLRNGCTFDLRTSSCELGLIPETFRKRPGVLRSIHPTHCTAAAGKRAAEFLAGHELCTVSVGRNSPYDKLVAARGKILLLGVTHAANTTLHLVENTAGAPTLSRELFHPIAVDTRGIAHTVPTHPHMPGLQRNYPRAEQDLLAARIQTNHSIAAATVRLIDAGPMFQFLSAKIREAPAYLLNIFTP